MAAKVLQRLLNRVAYIIPGGFTIRPWLHRLRGANIGKNVWIAQYVYIDELHPEAVTVGEGSTIGLRTSIFAHFYWGPRRPKNEATVTIEKNVFIGPHCVILPNVTIGEGAVIKAGSVVSRNVPAHAFWGSPPAELLGVATVPLTREHSYEEFTKGIRLKKRPKSPEKGAQEQT